VAKDTIQCHIDFTVDDTFRSTLAFLERLGPILARPSQADWCIDFTGCQYLGPNAAALLLAIWLDAKHHGLHPEILLPGEPAKLRAFCAFSGLAHHVTGAPLPASDDPRSETVPLRQITKTVWTDPDPIINLIHRHTALSEDEEENLRVCVQEVLQNIEDHASSPIGGVYCARYIGTRREIRVAFSDYGLGIEGTLKRNHPQITSASDAILRVIEGNYSSKSLSRNLGVGISNLALIVKNNGGMLTIISGDAASEITPGRQRPRMVVLKTALPGTSVFFTMRLSGESMVTED
jgi:hypothetical protein